MKESTKILLYGFLASVLLIALCLYQHRSEFITQKVQSPVFMGEKINDIAFINHIPKRAEESITDKSIDSRISEESKIEEDTEKEEEIIQKEEVVLNERTISSVVIIPTPTLAQLHIDRKARVEELKPLVKEDIDEEKSKSIVSEQVDKNLAILDNKPLVENNKVIEVEAKSDTPSPSLLTQDKISKLINHKISFYRNKAKLTSNTKKILDRVIVLLKENRPKKIIVEGYTDTSGKRAMNKWISLERAKSVKRYLVKYGISSRIIKTVGFGEDKLLYKNKPHSRLNRRVEIKIKD